MKDRNPIIEKILKGLEISFARLVDKKAIEDKELIFADKNGDIVRIKAKDLKKQSL